MAYNVESLITEIFNFFIDFSIDIIFIDLVIYLFIYRNLMIYLHTFYFLYLRTDARTHGRTDGRTYGQTYLYGHMEGLGDKQSSFYKYDMLLCLNRGARTHLKSAIVSFYRSSLPSIALRRLRRDDFSFFATANEIPIRQETK